MPVCCPGGRASFSRLQSGVEMVGSSANSPKAELNRAATADGQEVGAGGGRLAGAGWLCRCRGGRGSAIYDFDGVGLGFFASLLSLCPSFLSPLALAGGIRGAEAGRLLVGVGAGCAGGGRWAGRLPDHTTAGGHRLTGRASMAGRRGG